MKNSNTIKDILTMKDNNYEVYNKHENKQNTTVYIMRIINLKDIMNIKKHENKQITTIYIMSIMNLKDIIIIQKCKGHNKYGRHNKCEGHNNIKDKIIYKGGQKYEPHNKYKEN